jgi:hypothetical protein
VATVDAPSRYAAAAAARAIVSGALRQQAPRPASKPAMTAVTWGLSEHPLPDLVMAGCAGDPHATHARQPPGQPRGSSTCLAKPCGSRKPEAPSWDSLMILNCRRSLLAKISDFPG